MCRVCVSMCEYVGVCVYVCVCVYLYYVYFISSERLLLTAQNNKYNVRVQDSDGMLSKYFCLKDLYLCITDIHKKNLREIIFPPL